jgi:hypothetical protein
MFNQHNSIEKEHFESQYENHIIETKYMSYISHD